KCRVRAGGGSACILGRTPADLARKQDLRPGNFLSEDLFNAQFVSRVGIAVQKRDGDGCDAAGAKPLRGAPYRFFVQAKAHTAVGGKSLIDLPTQFKRNNRFAIAVKFARLRISVGAAAASNAQNFAKTARDDQPDGG